MSYSSSSCWVGHKEARAYTAYLGRSDEFCLSHPPAGIKTKQERGFTVCISAEVQLSEYFLILCHEPFVACRRHGCKEGFWQVQELLKLKTAGGHIYRLHIFLLISTISLVLRTGSQPKCPVGVQTIQRGSDRFLLCITKGPHQDGSLVQKHWGKRRDNHSADRALH